MARNTSRLATALGGSVRGCVHRLVGPCLAAGVALLCASARAEIPNPLSLTPQHFFETATIKDDAMETTAIISTVEGYKERRGLLNIVWNDNFLRAFIDKRSGAVTYQLYQRIYYEARHWRSYDMVNVQTPKGVETRPVTTIGQEVLSCSGGGDCHFVEDLGFDVEESLLRGLKQAYEANYNPP